MDLVTKYMISLHLHVVSSGDILSSLHVTSRPQVQLQYALQTL